MSPISFFKRHPHADLSAYLDGELAAGGAKRLEAHVVTCDVCSGQLDQLRETRSALRTLPEATTPRSFALTPEMARAAKPVREPAPARRVQPLVNGLRMTSAGLAVALAVVLVFDLSSGGGSSSSEQGLRIAPYDQSSENYAAAGPTQSSAATREEGLSSSATSAPSATGFENPVATSSSGAGTTLPGPVGGIDAAPQSGGTTPIPTLVAASTPAPSPSGLTYGGALNTVGQSSATDVPKAVSGEFGSATSAPEAQIPSLGALDDDSGIGALTIVLIVLGVLLAAALIGSIAASRLARKRP